MQCGSVALLAVEQLGSFRFLLRLIPFVLSLVYLVVLPAGGAKYSLRMPVVLGFAFMGFNLFHPESNTLLSGLAQIGLSIAVWGPVFWAGRIAITPDVIRKSLLLLWAFNTLSAGFGVLQVYFPGRFAVDPLFVKQMGGESADGLKIQLDDGTELFRPMGLTDTPGGAALAANSSIVMGVGVALMSQSRLLQLAVAGGAVVSMFCLYICQVRSLLILTAISVIGMLFILTLRGRGRSAFFVMLVGFGGAVAGLAWSTAVGEQAVLSRLETLWAGSAGEVYYSNRGVFLESTIEYAIPEYPFGAGLGRWGMMWSYFGNPDLSSSPALWAEITFTGWVYDGGVPLLICGYLAMFMALFFATKVAIVHRDENLAMAGSVVAATGLAALATTISAHVFVAQGGMMYCLLNAMLFAGVQDRVVPRFRPANS